MSFEIYVALLLHKAGKEINESNIKKILEAAGVKADDTKIKALVASLEGVNIDDAIKQAAVAPVAAVPVAAGGAQPKREEKKEEEKKAVDEAAVGLGALFG